MDVDTYAPMKIYYNLHMLGWRHYKGDVRSKVYFALRYCYI